MESFLRCSGLRYDTTQFCRRVPHRLIFRAELRKGRMFLRNFGTHLADYTLPQPDGPQDEPSPPPKPQISGNNCCSFQFCVKCSS
jgi:hypothetical protein